MSTLLLPQPPLSALIDAILGLPNGYADLNLVDGSGVGYRFSVFDIRHRASGRNVVYAFGQTTPEGIFIHYIGKADTLAERIAGHPRILEAVLCGANRLLVHAPAPVDPISHVEAERRLISYYAPPMNKQHNPFAPYVAAIG